MVILLCPLFRRVTHWRVKRRELCKLFLIRRMNENGAESQEEQRSPVSVLALTDCGSSESVQNTLSPYLRRGITFEYLCVFM